MSDIEKKIRSIRECEGFNPASFTNESVGFLIKDALAVCNEVEVLQNDYAKLLKLAQEIKDITPARESLFKMEVAAFKFECDVLKDALRRIADHENYDQGGDPIWDKLNPMSLAQCALSKLENGKTKDEGK